MTHRVAVVAVPPVTTFDLSIPDIVFGGAELAGRPAYDVRVCTAEPGVVETNGRVGVVVADDLGPVADADTVVVSGTSARDVDPRVVAALRAASARGARIASICTGAFVLAEAGLLDGRPATTLWPRAEELRRRHPAVKVADDVLFVDDGDVLTSAGLAAGLDLCLHLVRRDLGEAAAAAVARLAVVAPVRPGATAQVVATPLPPERGTSLAQTREWATGRLDEDLTLARLARHAGTSVRTFSRRFRAETGLSPLQWLLHQRVLRARELLEATALPMDEVARRSGLGTADSLRLHVTRRVGLTPSAYRAAFAHAG